MTCYLQIGVLGRRGVRVSKDGRPVSVLLESHEPQRLRLSEVLNMRVTGYDNAAALVFLRSATGLDAVMRSQSAFSEGRELRVRVEAEAHSDKRARVTLQEGDAPPSDAPEPAHDDPLDWDSEAGDAFAEAVQWLCGAVVPVADGMTMRIGRTPALTAIDVDVAMTRLSYRKSVLVMTRRVCELIALTGSGGIFAVDFKCGSRREDRQLLQAAFLEAASACGLNARADDIGKSGVLVATLAHKARSPLDWLLDEQGRRRPLATLLLASLDAEARLQRFPKAILELTLSTWQEGPARDVLERWHHAMDMKFGPRVRLVEEPIGTDTYRIEERLI